MLRKNEVTTWLATRLAPVRSQICGLYLFGSVLRGSASPRDCDIVVVTECHPDGEAWTNLKAHLIRLEDEFKATFRVPLAVVFMTAAEYDSMTDFRLKAAPLEKIEL